MTADVCDSQHKGRELLSYPEAVGRLLFRARPLGREPEAVPLTAAVGRTLAAPVALDRDEPPVRRSAMDGYAVRCADGVKPRILRGVVFAGTAAVPELRPGEAVAVMTGGTVVPGADAVVPVEKTRKEPAAEDGGEERVHLLERPMTGQNVRAAGEQGTAGRVLLESGRRLSAQDIVAAAGCGADPIAVAPRPRAVVLSTGDEVVSHCAQPAEHQVRDSNLVGAALQLARAGAEVNRCGLVRDQRAALEEAVSAALEAADLVVTIGGVSMGQKDLLPEVFARLEVEEMFHGVGIQPGKPVWAGIRGGSFVLALPGNPVSAFVILELFGAPLVARLSGGSPLVPRPLEKGRAGGPAATKARERFLPAGLRLGSDGTPVVSCRPAKGSGDWTSLAQAAALMHLPAHGEVEEGDPVSFLRLD